ncbi:MAG TPA: flagellar basal body P-ring formation chaperone FlgA [Verrucomicrobiae bacterium]
MIFAPVLVTPARRACGEPAAFQMKAEAKVDSAGIFLSQLIIPYPHATLPELRLAQAPVLGQTLSLSRQQIIELATNAFPAVNTTNWSGPVAVHISRRVRQLCEADVMDMLRAVLQRDYAGARGELEIHPTRPWQPVAAPDETLTLQVTVMPPAGILPNVMPTFEILCGKERVGSWQMPLQARIWREVPVAHSPLLRGELLRDADIALERRDVLSGHEAYIPYPVSDAMLETAASIQAGSPIWSRLARERTVLKRGQMVEALFQQGLLTISLKVETLEDGALGQTVRVRNPSTRRELYGKIQTENLVLITL